MQAVANPITVHDKSKKMAEDYILAYLTSHKIYILRQYGVHGSGNKGDYESKLIYFPIWAGDTIFRDDRSYPITKMPDGFKIISVGNIGVSQEMESIMSAALELKSILILNLLQLVMEEAKHF